MAAQRNFGLDLLRAVAILLVLGNHAYLVFFVSTGHVDLAGPSTFASILTFLSIEWLFVLSGFLIGAMMIRSFEAAGGFWERARSFWLRRWFRTVPAYYLFLVVNLLLVQANLAPGQYTVGHAFFAQNLFAPEGYPYFFPEAFSLAIDEWFYLLMPLLVGLFGWVRGWSLRTVFILSASVLIVVPMVARFVAAPPHDVGEFTRFLDWDRRFRRITLYHLDATGWGVLAAAANRWMPNAWSRMRSAAGVVGVGAMALGMAYLFQLHYGGLLPDRMPRLSNALSLSAIAAGTALALPWLTVRKARGGVVGAAIDKLSLYSYSIYLLHLPLLYLLLAALGDAGRASLFALGAQTVLWAALTFGGSAILFHAFEKPISDLRERFTRRVNASPFETPAT